MPKWTNEQLSAIETSGSNIIVSAGAGSGKTAVLTSRVINKLKNNIHINELLILTFTKAAAEEMKERIRLSIKEDPSLAKELELIDSSYITTFDSFSLSVVKKYHYYLNLSKNINITDSTIIEIQKKKILESIFDSYYENDNQDFNQMIEDFCVKDDQELKKSILSIANKIELLPDKERYLSSYIDDYFNEKTISNLINEYQNLIINKKEELKEELNNFSYQVDQDYFLKVSNTLKPLLESNDFEEILYMDIQIPQVPRNSEIEVKIAKDKLKKKIDELLIFRNYGSLKEIKENILFTKKTIKIIIDIIKEYFNLLDNYKKENEVFDFQDIALLSIKLLKENEEVRKELKESFKEIMIDEYQDTNDIQETFISLISDNNVYMVGDIKQSIYRFRNANPYIFKTKYDNYSKNQEGIKIDLLKNFRSRKEVLENINIIFNYIMDDEIGGADYITSHQMNFGNDSYINEGLTNQDYNMEFLEYPKDSIYSNDEVEIFTIGNDILNKIKNKYQIFDKGSKKFHNATYSDFVILMDRSTKFDLYKKIFEYLGIPLTIYKDEKLNDSYDLYIIKNLIDLVIQISQKDFNTKFKYDFMSIARSYLYRLDDQTIFEYFLNNNFQESSIYQDLINIALNINTKTPYQILQEIINKVNFYDKLTTIEDIDNSMVRIHKLLETTENISEIGYDIYDFNEYLNTLIEEQYDMKYSLNLQDNNSVRIMTIHKSKGLEYNICYFSGLDKSFNIRDIKEKFTYDNKYGIIVPLFKEGIRETIIKELLKYHYMEEEISEKIRLFYVALTRAKEKMIFLIPEKDYNNVYKNENGVISNSTRRKYKSFLDIILSIKKELNSYIKKIDIQNLNLSKDYLFNKESTLKEYANQELIVEEINIANQELQEKSYSKKLNELTTKEKVKNIKLGLEMHKVLELIDLNNPNYELIDNDFIKNKVKKFITSINLQDATIYKEYEFMYIKNNISYHGIIDLMLEYPDHIDIIDYKLNNILDDNYINQLQGYKDYINEISNKKVSIYLYSIICEELKRIQ